MMNDKSEFKSIEVGVVGLGLMGSSIIVSLLLAGHPVKAIAPIREDMDMAASRIRELLNHCKRSGLLNDSVEYYESMLEITENYQRLCNCNIVFECVIENMEIKASVYNKIAKEVSARTIIASNTSAIAISMLQKLVPNAERFIGIHWAEPAYATRFMEITCGANTCTDYAEQIFEMAHYWGKEPTLLRKDIRGFITNRLMYAVYREIFHLVEKGHATIEEVDKAFRYDAGSWITLMGIFRRMDFIGLADCTEILKTIFPKLCNGDKVPQLMQQMVDNNARGTQNLVGLYKYSQEDAKEWDNAFAMFNKDIYELASYYPIRENGVKQKKVPVI